MTYDEAYNQLNAMQRSSIAIAVCYEEPNPIEGEAAQAFYDALSKRDDQYSMMEQMEFELSQEILAQTDEEYAKFLGVEYVPPEEEEDSK